jgi:ribose transport system substrate-binding protein
MNRKWTAIVPAIFGIMLTVSACGKEDAPTFTGNITEEPTYQDSLNVISPTAYNNVRGLKVEPGAYISIIGRESGSAYWKEIKRGALQAAVDLNGALGYTGDDEVKVTYNAPEDVENIDEQVNLLDEELARYPDALGIASIDAEACKVQFDLATENGIPIIALDSGNSYQGIQCTIKTDNAEAAKTGAYKLSDEMEDEGSVLLLVHDSKSASSLERLNSFKSEIEENHPGVSITETLYLDKMDDMKKEIAEDKNKSKKEDEKKITSEDLNDTDVVAYYLEKHPDIKGCFGTNITATQLGLKTLKQEDKIKDVILMGFDGKSS